MATERFIIGKHDDGKHDGRASNVRREMQANYAMADFMAEPNQEILVFEAPSSNRQRHADNLRRLHGSYYKGTYYHNGVGQKGGGVNGK